MKGPTHETRSDHLQMLVLGLFLVGGVFMMGSVIAFVLQSSGKLETGMSAGALPTIMQYAPAVLAVASFAVAFVLRRALTGSETGGTYQTRVMLHKRALIIALVMNEASALVALVFILMMGLNLACAVAVAVALAGLILHLPRKSEFDALME